MYDRLLPSHQVLVDQGKIEQGMSKEAVFLAWGNPATKFEGEDIGGSFERWTYTSLRRIYTNRINIGYGHGYGRRGPYGYETPYGYGNSRHRRYGYGGADIAYITQRSAVVDFKSGRVTRWQRGKKSY